MSYALAVLSFQRLADVRDRQSAQIQCEGEGGSFGGIYLNVTMYIVRIPIHCMLSRGPCYTQLYIHGQTCRCTKYWTFAQSSELWSHPQQQERYISDTYPAVYRFCSLHWLPLAIQSRHFVSLPVTLTPTLNAHPTREYNNAGLWRRFYIWCII